MHTQLKRTVIAVDDDDINLMVLVKSVEEAGYVVKAFTSGQEAWSYLRSNPQGVDIALIDKMMPGMNGIELLSLIKREESLKYMPVILQTGDAGVSQMREGLEGGAYYYLTKPFHPEILAAVLHSAAGECAMREEIFEQMKSGYNQFIGLMADGEFIIRTHAEARTLAAAFSQATAYPELIALGLMELLANAIEHGNLEIGYQRKQKCLLTNSWQQELAARAGSAEYSNRVVRVHAEKTEFGMHLTITDEGKGFDWRPYMYETNASERMNDPNGRGIIKAMIMLDDLRYAGKGNQAHCNLSMPSVRPALKSRPAASNTLHN